MSHLKMYILVKDSIPAGKAVVGVAHASLACYLKYADDAIVKEWLAGPFYKTVCSVNEKEFEKAKSESDRVVMTESTLDYQETVIAFKPREEYPKYFKFFRLYK
ncbi:peptidyl-tRNA hydrolase [Gilvibacter sediminis]|uniref:peptidyl-tRNA hydrolase n=1 Tax=Gilvibacter sediminis TaxID=379071 RepID=UPI002350F434|nr:peptidyl-tRNA hydrolase [Gilvibacter sediminis]MDC7999175.1 peptidyl-tRNA hydrolase [Gilvibacter sediminis]